MPPIAPAPVLSKPDINFVRLGVSKNFQEAVHVSWSKPHQQAVAVISFTLLRMFGADTFYSVVSENIPADTLNFYDQLESTAFPAFSTERNTVLYRVFALDELERSGDTSEACTLWLLQQPSLQDIDLNGKCISWFSSIHFGGLSSYCRVWKDSLHNSFTGPEQLVFPHTDKPAVFTACFSEQVNSSGRWHYALFLKSSDSHSLRTGYFDVP